MVLAVVRRVRSRQVDVGICVVYPNGEGEGGERKGGEGKGEGDEGGLGRGMEKGSVCADEWPAVLRKEDVRATEKEKVVCAEGFRVGDVVRAVVVGLTLVFGFFGGQSVYYMGLIGEGWSWGFFSVGQVMLM